MKRPAKFLFDECINLPVLQALRTHCDSLPEPPQLAHVIELLGEGERDEDWIPQIATDGWIVISTDRGKGGLKKGKKLELVCVEQKVTHILVAASIHEKKTVDKIEILKQAWPKIDRTRKAEPGTRFSMRFNNKGEVVVEKRPPRA